MLEYLFLHVGGYFGGDELYLVRNQGGGLEADALYASERLDLDYRRHSIRRTLTMSPEQSKQWLQKLEQIHFDYWEESYYACGVCDGTQWSLTYKYSGKEREKCGGSNAYPENWSSFISSINKITSKMSVVAANDDSEKDIEEFYRLYAQVENDFRTKDRG